MSDERIPIFDDILFWSQVIGDSKRTIICPTVELAEKVRAAVSGYHEVVVDPAVPAGQVVVIDRQALAASEAQLFQTFYKNL